MTHNERITANLKLVHHVALKYANARNLANMQYDDLYQIGCIGLIKASHNFDRERDIKFSTFAVYGIRGEIIRYLTREGALIKTPRLIGELYRKIARANMLDRSPFDIVKTFHCTLDAAKKALAYAHCHVVSTEIAVANEGGTEVTIGDMLSQDDDHSQMYIRDFLSSLSDRERMTALLRIEGKTQQEIATTVGVAQVSVSRILQRVGRKYLAYQSEVSA